MGMPAFVAPSLAVPVDCTDPNSPGNRPGGYCSISDATQSLSLPGTDTGLPSLPLICPQSSSVEVKDRVHVAIVTLEYLILQQWILANCPP